MVVCIIGGRGGTGKTCQLITVARMFSTTRWAYMEKKDETNLESITEIDSIRIHAIDNDFNDSPVGMLKSFEAWRNGVRDDIKNDVAIDCIVIDGVSDLRRYAYEEWLKTHPLYDKKTNKKTEREGIAEGNIGAWRDINDRVKKLIEPLINIAYYKHCHLFMTAITKKIYIDNKYKHDEPDIKDWLEYPCECIFVFSKEKRAEKYECSCEKAPLWSGSSGWIEELRKDTGLVEALSMHGLL